MFFWIAIVVALLAHYLKWHPAVKWSAVAVVVGHAILFLYLGLGGDF